MNTKKSLYERFNFNFNDEIYKIQAEILTELMSSNQKKSELMLNSEDPNSPSKTQSESFKDIWDIL